MFNDQAVIKNELAINLLNKFGEALHNEVFSLIDKLHGKDTYINNNLLLNLQNILPLEKQDAAFYLNLAHELAATSAFAPVLLLEKIPTLYFYGVGREIAEFLLNIKDYGGRAVALFLGSDLLKTEDLIDVLEQSTLPFYRSLLAAVNARHTEFGVCCAMIMRSSAKLETVINAEEIEAHLDVCSDLLKNYGVKITEQYLKNSHAFMSHISLDLVLLTLENLAAQSLVLVEFAVTYPDIFFARSSHSAVKINDTRLTESDCKAIKLEILKKEDYFAFLDHSFLFEDLDFLSLILSWPTLSQPIKTNILFQLQQDNYKNYILTRETIAEELRQINQVTNSNWLNSWMFCGEVIDLAFIRKRMGQLLQKPGQFSIEAKSIVKQHSIIFDRSNPEYSLDRVGKMVDTLLQYCVGPFTELELRAMAQFILGDSSSLRNFLSNTSLVLQVWGRDPWHDYGRSDELFSCTSLGDYNAGNAPGFISDLNLNNLDIWSNGARVGRVHLSLIKDLANNTLLLLDCVDGTERIIASKKKSALIMEAILAYARWIGIEQIKVNYDIDYNTTPKKFIAYLEHTKKAQPQIDFVSRFLTVSTTRQLIPYPCQTFLESFIKANGAFVRGALISPQTTDLST